MAPFSGATEVGADFKLKTKSALGVLSLKISVALMEQEENGSFQSKLVQLFNPKTSV